MTPPLTLLVTTHTTVLPETEGCYRWFFGYGGYTHSREGTPSVLLAHLRSLLQDTPSITRVMVHDPDLHQYQSLSDAWLSDFRAGMVTALFDKPAPRAPIPFAEGVQNVFGPVLYARMHNGGVECPGCGHRAELVGEGRGTLCQNTHCLAPSLPVVVVHAESGRGWVGFDLQELLDRPAPGYFFPRGWAPSSPWVSRATLLALKEKSQ